jgi:hypothetical protein
LVWRVPGERFAGLKSLTGSEKSCIPYNGADAMTTGGGGEPAWGPSPTPLEGEGLWQRRRFPLHSTGLGEQDKEHGGHKKSDPKTYPAFPFVISRLASPVCQEPLVIQDHRYRPDCTA